MRPERTLSFMRKNNQEGSLRMSRMDYFLSVHALCVLAPVKTIQGGRKRCNVLHHEPQRPLCSLNHEVVFVFDLLYEF